MYAVSRYDTTGYVEDLPSLNEGRYIHGCGVYTDESGEQVRVITYSTLYYCYYKYHCQVFLVTGGVGDHGHYLSSTELLTSSTSSWTMARNLPRSMAALRGVTLGGVLYMTG